MSRPERLGPAGTLPLARVETELRRLWEDAGEGGSGLVRACVLNLVILSESAPGIAPDDRGLSELVAAVTAEHPCRVVRACSRPGEADAAVAAHISAFCHRSGPADRQVCCEQISVTAAGEPARHLHSALAALLVADLPVFLWWRGLPPWGSHRLEHLSEMADRLLVDSSEAPDPVAALAGLARWRRDAGPAVAAAGDLAWRRTSGWREATAALFDPPAVQERMAGIRAVTIHHGGAPARPDRLQALYLAGWLAGRLGWLPRPATARPRQDRLGIELDAGSHVVDLALVPAEGEAVIRLDCSDPDGGEAVAVVAAAGPDSAVVSWQDSGGRTWTRTLGLPDADRAALLSRELEFPQGEAIYGEALPLAGSLAGLWSPARSS